MIVTRHCEDRCRGRSISDAALEYVLLNGRQTRKRDSIHCMLTLEHRDRLAKNDPARHYYGIRIILSSDAAVIITVQWDRNPPRRTPAAPPDYPLRAG